MELVIATTNQGKLVEIEKLLKDFPIELKSLKDFGPIAPIIEDGKTFDDNAYKKASLTSRMLGCPALAEDSGLCVEALDGAPGVLSARFAGDNADDKQNNEKLLTLLKDEKNRKAYFKTVISISIPTGHALTYEGKCEGEIAKKLIGNEGFGYDPLFFFPPLNKTFGQISLKEKNEVSHRGRAFSELVKEFDKVLIWLEQNLPKLDKFECKKG